MPLRVEIVTPEGVIYAEPNHAVSIPPSPDQDHDGTPKGEDPSSSPTIGIPRIGG